MADELFTNGDALRARLIEPLRAMLPVDDATQPAPLSPSLRALPGWRLLSSRAPSMDNGQGAEGERHLAAALYTPIAGADWLLGVGPVFSLSADGEALPTRLDWGLSISLWTRGKRWLLGSTLSRLWSAPEDGEASDGRVTWQTYIGYRLSHDWYLVSSPRVELDLDAPSASRWTVPVGGGIGRLFDLGGIPLDASLQGYYNLDHPRDAGAWSLRLQLRYAR